MAEMTKQIRDHLNAHAGMKKKDIIINNFLGGVSWGFGTVIGATIVAAIIIWLLKSIGVFGAISDTLKDVNTPLPVQTQINRTQ